VRREQPLDRDAMGVEFGIGEAMFGDRRGESGRTKQLRAVAGRDVECVGDPLHQLAARS
jgi:hypothetical protein